VLLLPPPPPSPACVPTPPPPTPPASLLLLSGPVADPRPPAFRGRVNMSVFASTDHGVTFTSTQLVSGPTGYSTLSQLPLPSPPLSEGVGGRPLSVGLLFEQADASLCEPCLPSWAHAPGGCAARGLGAESCKISLMHLPLATLGVPELAACPST
jgi:hypothetical protein